jgi:abequosyltransferase
MIKTEVSPRLSICIATMNRADIIGETIESILSQACADVEIVVLDGASTDNTQEILEGYQRRFPALRYIRESVNGGVDKDFDRAVEAASGEYCWLMSDDDLLATDAVTTVLAAIDRAFSLIVVNAEVRTRDMLKVVEPRLLPFDSDREYAPDRAEVFFKDAANYLSFIGCVIIRRSIWMERQRERYYGSLFIHMGVIFQAPLPGKILVVARTLVSIRYGNAMWRSKEFEIWMFKWPDLLWSFDSISPAARAAVTKVDPWRRLKTLLIYRAKGSYSVNEYRRWIEPRLASLRERIGPRSVAAIPGFAANMAALVYSLIPRPGAKMFRIDMKKSRYYFGNWFNAKDRS